MEYLCNKHHDLIMYEPNIYVNNSKYISIVDVSVFQLPWRLLLYCRKFAQDWRSLIVFRRCIGLPFVTLPCLSRFILFSHFLLSQTVTKNWI